jgi:NhaP-type Na+/H+ or K+/H+ antiporter
MSIEFWGALCFGLVVGWVTYRTLRRTKQESNLADIATVIGSVGGAAVTSLFKSGALFAAYCIGLAIGFFGYFAIALIFPEKDALGKRISPFKNGIMAP